MLQGFCWNAPGMRQEWSGNAPKKPHQGSSIHQCSCFARGLLQEYPGNVFMIAHEMLWEWMALIGNAQGMHMFEMLRDCWWLNPLIISMLCSCCYPIFIPCVPGMLHCHFHATLTMGRFRLRDILWLRCESWGRGPRECSGKLQFWNVSWGMRLESWNTSPEFVAGSAQAVLTSLRECSAWNDV